MLERRIPVLDFFFIGILEDLLISEKEATLEEVIFLIWVAAPLILYLTLIVDRRSHQHAWFKEQ